MATKKKQDPKGGARAAAPETSAAEAPKHRQRNQRVGVVVKARMQKSVVVSVERLVQHPVYRKTIRRTSTFMAHDEKGARKGDTVRIVETRPLSKSKRWRVEEILTRATAVEDTASEVLA